MLAPSRDVKSVCRYDTGDRDLHKETVRAVLKLIGNKLQLSLLMKPSKKELDSKFLVDPLASAQRRKRMLQTPCLLFKKNSLWFLLCLRFLLYRCSWPFGLSS